MTYVIYKEEFDATFLEFVKKRYVVESETDTRIIIHGRQGELEKIAKQMYKSAKDIKKDYPEFKTIDDEASELFERFNAIRNDMQDALLCFCGSDAVRTGVTMNESDMAKFAKLKALYFELEKIA